MARADCRRGWDADREETLLSPSVTDAELTSCLFGRDLPRQGSGSDRGIKGPKQDVWLTAGMNLMLKQHGGVNLAALKPSPTELTALLGRDLSLMSLLDRSS